MDTTIRPYSPATWIIEVAGGSQRLGEIREIGLHEYKIVPDVETKLASVEVGPYPAKEDAMTAIATHLGGSCTGDLV